jgi:uncharacterized Zn finger protein (UPF0148 family)
MHALLIVGYLLFGAILMRALLVHAKIMPATCARCGLPLERRRLGEQICSCDRRGRSATL